MSETTGLFAVQQPTQRRLHWGDGVVLLGVVVFLYVGIALAVHTPPALRGPEISLDPHILPYYAGLSIVRMAVAYLFSLLFALLYGRAAAHNHRVEQVLMPLPRTNLPYNSDDGHLILLSYRLGSRRVVNPIVDDNNLITWNS